MSSFTTLHTNQPSTQRCKTCRNPLPLAAFPLRKSTGDRLRNCQRCLDEASRAWRSQSGLCTVCNGALLADADDFAAGERVVPDAALYITRGELVHSGCLKQWNVRRFCQLQGRSTAAEVA